MYRADSTTPEHQHRYRGRHRTSNGRDGYGQTVDRRVIRCDCGWKLRGVPATVAGYRAASKEHADHLAEVAAHGGRP